MTTSNRARGPILTPSKLTCYQRCPEQYRHRYVERRRIEEPFSPALAKGSAAHRVLDECFEYYRHVHAFPYDVRDRVEYYLPRPPYPTDLVWQRDVDQVVGQIEFAMLAFDPAATVLATETPLDFAYGGSADCPPFVLRTRVDRVLRYPDGVIEHGDYKTGSSAWVDPIQNVAARIVVGQHYRRSGEAVRSSTIFLAGRAIRVEELTREQVGVTWREIKRLANAILAEQEWQPVRSKSCEWCPFFDNGCSLDPAGDVGDEMTAWLDGAA